MSAGQTLNCTLVDETTVLCNGTLYVEGEGPLGPDEPGFWIYIGVYVALVLFAGLMAGLTLGLLSQDLTTLQVLSTAGTPSEQRYAKRILPLVKNSHLLLVTLLLANAAAAESMPLFLDHVTSPIIAIIVSVSAVLIFGEVLPQAICSKYGLAVGANMAWFVYILIALEFVIAWPIAKIITLLLGEGTGTFYRRSELKALVDLHVTSPDAAAEDSALSRDEVLIIKGALDAESKVAQDAMIPLNEVFMLDSAGVLDRNVMQQLMAKGYSHVPVFNGDRQNIQGEFVVKNLIILDPKDHVPVSEALTKYGRPLNSIASSEPVYNILDEMMDGKYRMAAVYDDQTSPVAPRMLGPESAVSGRASAAVDSRGLTPSNAVPLSPTLPTTTSPNGGTIVGVIMLFNVLEVVLGEPIISADDVYADVKKKVNVGKVKLVRSHSHAPGTIVPTSPAAGSLSPIGSINTPLPSTAEDTPLLLESNSDMA